MPKKAKQMPEEFKTYEDAAEFWDAHDSTSFINDLEEVKITVDLQKSARRKGINPNELVSELLHEQLVGSV